jgi:hypothetical protein
LPVSEPQVSAWTSWATSALAKAGARLRVIGANTPKNLTSELDRIEREWRRGNALLPKFVYDPVGDTSPLRRVLLALAAEVGGRGPLGELYAAKALELVEEATLCESAGGPGLWGAARRRYARRDRFEEAADATAREWLAQEAPSEVRGDLIRSDDSQSPFSLLSRMRFELGRRRLAVRVVARDNLCACAATGNGFVLVARGRYLRRADVERTVLHEVCGHVEPQVAAQTARLGIYAVGTARGSDDQEGRALALEQRSGVLDATRRRELALRHVAARSLETRADFVETTYQLLRYGAPLKQALQISARAHRGGGLGREAIYLPAFLRVEAATSRDPQVDAVLARGRVSVDVVAALRQLEA